MMFSRDRVSTLSNRHNDAANSKPDGLRPNRNTSSVAKKRAVVQQSYDGKLINEMMKMINKEDDNDNYNNNIGESESVSEGRVKMNKNSHVDIKREKRQ